MVTTQIAVRTISDLVQQIRGAVEEASIELAQAGIAIKKADLKIKGVFKVDAGGKLKFWLVEVGADVSRELVQVVSLTFEAPETTRGREVAGTVQDGLREGMLTIAASVREAVEALGLPLKEASVAIDIAIDTSGAIKVYVGGGAETSNTQSVTLTLGPTDNETL